MFADQQGGELWQHLVDPQRWWRVAQEFGTRFVWFTDGLAVPGNCLVAMLGYALVVGQGRDRPQR